jgi:hypothetical protein
MEVSGSIHVAPTLPSPHERAPIPIGYEAGWVQSPSRRGAEEKKNCFYRELNPGCSACNLVAVLTELS